MTSANTTNDVTTPNGKIIEQMLMQQVEDRQKLYKTIIDNHQTEGIAVIFILDILPKTDNSSQPSRTQRSSKIELPIAPIDKYKIIKRARRILQKNGIFDEVFNVVKYDEHRIFILCSNAIVAMERMLKSRRLVNEEFALNPLNPYPQVHITLSGGCEKGYVFELTKDYFGDPVNVASKLAEDTAEPGELLLSFGGKETEIIPKMSSKAKFELGTVLVSGVNIEYYSMEENNRSSILNKLFSCCGSEQKKGSKTPPTSSGTITPVVSIDTTTDLNNTTEKNQWESSTSLGSEWEDLVVIQSDLSGFTRLTKKYGILHFMTIILNCRKIFNDALKECNGELLKYDGDNIMCKFQSSHDAIKCVLQISEGITTYNSDKEKDFQIRAKISMAKGLILVNDGGDIMIGHAWEECCQLSEDIAQVGEILVTEEIMKDLKNDRRNPFKCEFETRPETEEVAQHYNVKMKS